MGINLNRSVIYGEPYLSNYIYLKEIEYIKRYLYKELAEELIFLKEDFSNKHMSQPAHIYYLYKPRKYEIEIIIDSGYLNALINYEEASLPLHRYYLNKNEYDRNDFKLIEGCNNDKLLESFLNKLIYILKQEELYFYLWKNGKLYKKQGGKLKRLKDNEF